MPLTKTQFKGGEKQSNPGANLKIKSYNASVVAIYNASNSIAHFDYRNYFTYIL
jgi:hypothetical protein